MADDWEQEDWEKEDFAPVLPGAAAAAAPPKPSEPAFEDEDAAPEPPPKAVEHTIQSQPKKKVEKKYDKGEVVDVPLDDPVAEKLRRQRLEEEADLRAARETFGSGGGGGGKALEELLPKTLKDFESYAELLVSKYVAPHATSKNYKGLLKAVLRAAMEPLGADDAKEVEAAVAGVRADKVKAAQAAAASKKNKKSINVGKSGLSAGLDDYVYEGAAGPDDDYDFM